MARDDAIEPLHSWVLYAISSVRDRNAAMARCDVGNIRHYLKHHRFHEVAREIHSW